MTVKLYSEEKSHQHMPYIHLHADHFGMERDEWQYIYRERERAMKKRKQLHIHCMCERSARKMNQ